MRSSERYFTFVLLALFLTFSAACNSGSASKRNDANAGGSDSGYAIDVLCMADRINNPVESFHYSYKYADGSGWTNKEADITPQTMDITIKDKSGAHSYHGTRADENSWNQAVIDLSNLNITIMSARLGAVSDGSGVSRQGSETVNGYSATKYAIDTAGAKSADQEKFEALFGKGSFEKGMVWISDDGCAVKLVLDEGIVRPNNNFDKAHFELDRIRK